jgi:hypothetical protein
MPSMATILPVKIAMQLSTAVAEYWTVTSNAMSHTTGALITADSGVHQVSPRAGLLS